MMAGAPAVASETHNTNVYCPSGYQVGAYSRTTFNGYQNHYYSDLNSDEIWSKSTDSYILASDSTYNDSYLSWYTSNTYKVYSSRCA